MEHLTGARGGRPGQSPGRAVLRREHDVRQGEGRLGQAAGGSPRAVRPGRQRRAHGPRPEANVGPRRQEAVHGDGGDVGAIGRRGDRRAGPAGARLCAARLRVRGGRGGDAGAGDPGCRGG